MKDSTVERVGNVLAPVVAALWFLVAVLWIGAVIFAGPTTVTIDGTPCAHPNGDTWVCTP